MWRSILVTIYVTCVAQYGAVWRRVARVMALASEASTPYQLQPGTLAILKEANSCTIWQSLGGRYPGAPSSGVWCRVLPRRLGEG